MLTNKLALYSNFILVDNFNDVANFDGCFFRNSLNVASYFRGASENIWMMMFHVLKIFSVNLLTRLQFQRNISAASTLNEPSGPSVKTAVPGPNSKKLFKELNELQVQNNLIIKPNYKNNI